MKKIIIMTAVCIGCLMSEAYADGDKLNISCQDGILTITGTGDLAENELISFICVDSPVDEEILSDETTPYFIDAYNAVGNEINTVISLPDTLSGGKYYIVASGKDFYAYEYFMYIDKSKIDDAIDKINNAKSPDEIGKIIIENEIDVDMQLYEDNKDIINQILYTGRDDGYDTDRLISVLYKSYLATMITNGESETAFLSYCENEELNTAYQKIENVTEFENLFKESDFESDSVEVSLRKAFIASGAKSANGWIEIRNEILMSDDGKVSEEAEEFFDFSVFDKVKNKNSVFQKMAEKTAGVKSFKELKTLFENTSDKVYNAEKKPDKGGSSSGSSSGGGSGGVYAPVVAEKNEKEENKTENQNVFDDILNHWAEDDIKKLYSKGIINGYEDNTFRPDGNIKRAEFVKMICEAFGINRTGEMNFTDVFKNDWYYKYIESAYVSGVINGTGDCFAPNDKITREDASVILYRILSKNHPFEKGTLSFIDKSDISDYAQEAIGAMKNEGIIEGVGKNRFEPKQPVTRAQCAVLINKCLLRFELTE